MSIVLDGVQAGQFDSYEALVKSVQPDRARHVMAVRMGGKTYPLNAAPAEQGEVSTLTYYDAEGRRVYERTLRFVFLMAVNDILPGTRVRLEHSFGHAIYVDVFGSTPLTVRLVSKIEARMREIIREDLAFEQIVLSRDAAIDFFREKGQPDKVRLLKHRKFDTFTLYQLGDYREYFYGVMTPSTGYIDVFALSLYLPGLMLMLPDPLEPRRVAPLRDLPKLMQTYTESARWTSILECSNAADLNGLTATGNIRPFIRVNEALHDRAIHNIADEFVKSGARIILIAGPSSSGKTTFAYRLSIALRVLGLRPMKLSLDDYYIDRDAIPMDADGQRDLERLDTLDVPLFNEHLVRLLQGEEVETPIFNFEKGMRTEKTRPLSVGREQPIIIEGIHGLNDALTEEAPRSLKYKIYVSALTTLNLDDHNRIRTTDARLIRRMVRDQKFRGTSPETTLSMWSSVRRGEENYIFPFQEQADIMFNTSLVYELAVLKKYVYPFLTAIAPESPHFAQADRLVKFLNYFLPADVEDEIPPDSILREFIGESCFYKTGH